MVHTKDFLLNYKNEGAFCSGHDSTADSPTELVAADCTAVDRILSFKPGLPKPQRLELFHLASDLTPDVVMTECVGQGKGSLKAYLQTSVFYDWAVSATLGTTGTSKAFRYKSPYAAAERDLYGCLCTHWDMEAEIKKPTYQNVEWICTQAKTASTTPIVGGILAFSTATPQTFKTFTVATVDAKTIANMKIQRIKFSVDNTFAENDESMQLASDYSLSPQLKERSFEFEIDYLLNGSDTWDADTINTTVQLCDATLTNGLFTLSPVNYMVWETNMDELEDRGIVKRTGVFKRGVASTQVKS